MEHLQDNKCDICFVQETFFREGDKAKVKEIENYGWKIISNPRKHRTGGGIAMLYRSSLELTCNTKVTKYKSFAHSVTSLKNLKTTLTTFLRNKENLLLLVT